MFQDYITKYTDVLVGKCEKLFIAKASLVFFVVFFVFFHKNFGKFQILTFVILMKG